MKKYEDKWYKVWYMRTLYDRKEYSLFEYAFGDKQVKRFVKKLNAYKVTEWTI